MQREIANGCRYRPEDPAGHYESWFQRANHPTKPLGFWIRYTIFSPAGRPEDAIGELWAIYFDGESDSVFAIKEERPIAECSFAKTGLKVAMGASTLDASGLIGEARGGDRRFAWSLRYETEEEPLLLLPKGFYSAPFPKAKALVGSPNARFFGSLSLDEETIAVDGWLGSQNHNWGSKHTDRYAWGQVAGFDGEPGSFLELSTAKVKLGPLSTPWMTPIVLRIDGEELCFKALRRTIRAHGRYDYFHWSFATSRDETTLSGTISAPAEHFVALPYRNPPGGEKVCLNSKIASASVTLRRPGRAPRVLHSRQRAAFEILTDDRDHGLSQLRLDVGAHDGLGRGAIGLGRFASASAPKSL